MVGDAAVDPFPINDQDDVLHGGEEGAQPHLRGGQASVACLRNGKGDMGAMVWVSSISSALKACGVL
ncbi:MAG: hypothetical protein IPO15_27355 [Anaerolineae bacterium]|uniref:hypothetical protein n=1 Tax=Candidatus Amarolinea dominans TaxID=3140696 RepID=UPI003135E7F1|nr:hypothetical protein [Anaerolineae bacterium]